MNTTNTTQSNSQPTRRLAHLLRLALLLVTLTFVVACASPVETPTPVAQPAAGGTNADAVQSAAPDDATADAAGEPQVDQLQPSGASAPTPTVTPPPISGRVVLWHSWAGADGDALTAILAALR